LATKLLHRCFTITCVPLLCSNFPQVKRQVVRPESRVTRQSQPRINRAWPGVHLKNLWDKSSHPRPLQVGQTQEYFQARPNSSMMPRSKWCPRTIGIGLRKGPRRVQFLMNELPLRQLSLNSANSLPRCLDGSAAILCTWGPDVMRPVIRASVQLGCDLATKSTKFTT